MAATMVTLLSSCGATPTASSSTAGSSESVSSSASELSSTEPAKQVTLTYWHTYSEGEEKVLKDEVIPAFEKANPSIKINAVRMPLDGLQQQVVTAVAGDAAPDVMRMDITWVAQLAKVGALKPLSGYEGFDTLTKNTLQSAMQTTYYNGECYGLPLNTNTTTSVWNMDLLSKFGSKEPPKTIDEMVTLAKKVNSKSEQKWVFTIAGTYTWAMLPWFWSLGGTMTNEDYTKATGYLNSEDSVKALETIAGWYKDGVISPAIIGEEPGAWNGMSGGNYAMISEGPWFFSSNSTTFMSQAAVMPSGKGGSISVTGGEDIVMLKTTKNEKEVWAFMNYLLSDDAQLAMTKAGLIPTTTTATGKMDTSATPYMSAYLEQLKNAKPRIPSANYPAIDELLGKTFERVIRGEIGAKQALDDAAAQVDTLLK